MPDRSRRRRPRWRRPLALGVGAAVVLVAAGGGVAWAMSGRTADRFTTTTVAMGSVKQTVSATGTVASALRRDVSFPVAGTVASVKVGLGDTVTAGEVLASLDPTSLQSGLDTANTTLQQAQQQLSDDLQSQTSGTSSTTSTTSTTTSATPTSSAAPTQPSGSSPTGKADQGGTSPEVAKAGQAVAAAQQALLAAYDAAHAAIGVSTQALTDAQAACTGITGLDPSTVVPDGGTPTPAPTPTPSESSTAAPTAPTVSDVQALIVTCQKKLADASTAQADTKTKQQAVSDAATALDKAVAELQQALAASSSGTGSSGTGSTTGQGSTPSSTHAPTSSSSSTSSSASSQSRASSSSGTTGASQQGKIATAEDILADRAAIDAAQSQADIATQDLALINLTSPIAGTVGAVSITAGSHVSASSTSAVITVLGTTGYVVDITVPLTSLDKLAVGQSATVAVPSTATQLTGKVSSIGVLDVSSTSTPEYDLVVALDPTQEKLFDGSSAQVSIAVAGTGQVITVPTSAVHVSGQKATVQVLANGQVSDVTVERGAVGAQLTEITSGLTVGQTVVLADRSQALPNSSTNNQNSGLSGLTNRSTTRVGGGTFGGGGSFRPGG